MSRTVTALIAAIALGATACQAPVPVVAQQQNTGSYTVRLELDSTSLGPRAVTIRLSAVRQNRGDVPEPEQVVIATTMPTMGMPGTTVTATPVSPYQYEARGQLFTMLGKWRVEVRLTVGGADEIANFDVEAVP